MRNFLKQKDRLMMVRFNLFLPFFQGCYCLVRKTVVILPYKPFITLFPWNRQLPSAILNIIIKFELLHDAL